MAHDQATLDDLLAHGDWMRGLARRLLGDRDEADDLVQETWLNALRVPPARGQTLRPWIATVLLNLIRSRARSRARAQVRHEQLPAPEAAPTAEEVLAQRQTERALAQLLLALDEPYRRTILLRFHEGRSSADIARAEGIPEGTVRWRLKYGLDELRRRFTAGEDGRTRALGALIPLAGPSAPPALVPAAASWLGGVGLVKGVAISTASAVAVLAVVTVGVRHEPGRATLAGSKVAWTSGSGKTAGRRALAPNFFPLAPSDEATPLPSDDATPALAEGAQASLPVVPPPPTRIPITGVVRDSQGQVAAGVPVTLRKLAGAGVADHVTTTDAAGRFSHLLQSRGSFLLTAELNGEPAPRLMIDVRTDAGISIGSASPASLAMIDVSVDASPRRPAAGAAKALPGPRPAAALWCCREAYAAGDVVYGRACLKFGRWSDRGGCDLFGLKTELFCSGRVHGGLSTSDLSRTDRLDCDGRLLESSTVALGRRPPARRGDRPGR
jgi:RNA polymerase sigma-70 factor (ECF subfamily)